MKTMKTTLMSLALFITSMTATAQPMSYYAMRENARFLTDRMAYTLGIATSLLDDLYMINYDYICGVNDYLDDVAYGYHYDDYMTVLYARDAALRRLLTPYQWTRLVALDYFYRPISFVDRRWTFSIYAYDPYRTRFYYHVPHHFNDYRGGHFFRGMAPVGGRIGGPHGGPNRPVHGNQGGPGYRIGDGGHHGDMNRGGGNGMNNGRDMNHGGGNNRDMDRNNRDMNRGGGNMNGMGNSNIDRGAVRTVSTGRNMGGSSDMNVRPSSTRSSSTPSMRSTSTPSVRSSSTPVMRNTSTPTSAPSMRSTSAPSTRSSSFSGSSRGSGTSGAGRGSSGGGGSRGGGRR